MISLKFDQPNIESWANFSGDFNPIHFDIERAKQAGSDDIIVHGMLPLLYAKQAITDRHLNSTVADQWLSIKCRLKSPMQRNTVYGLSVQGTEQKGKFTISAEDKSASAQGNYIAGDAAVKGVQGSPIEIDSHQAKEMLALFAKSFPKIDSLWVAIDSLTFARFLSSEIPFAMAKSMQMTGDAKNQSELMSQALTIQTFHAAKVNPEWLEKRLVSMCPIEEIQVYVQEPATIRNGNAELLGSNELDVYVNGALVIKSEVGLMLKLN
jgi:hypothetical protein